MALKDPRFHVETTYYPLLGKFFAGDHSKTPVEILDAHTPALATEVDKSVITSPQLSLTAKTVARSPRTASPLTAAADPAQLSHLQQIQLIRKPIGEPVEYFALDNAFAKLNVDMLQARESVQGTFEGDGYLDPLEETKASEAKYDEIEYNLKKLTYKIYTPIEDIMRTVINPMEISQRTAVWDLKRRRNKIAAAVLKAGVTSNVNVAAIGAISTGFHSTNKTASEIAAVINDHLEANASLLDVIVMNNKDFAKYTENTWTGTGPVNMQFNRVIGAGVVPFPGIPNLTGVIDPMVPEGVGYLIDKMNGARLAEGPKITRRFYDEEKDAEAIKVSDFNQYKIVTPTTTKVNRLFTKKLTFA